MNLHWAVNRIVPTLLLDNCNTRRTLPGGLPLPRAGWAGSSVGYEVSVVAAGEEPSRLLGWLSS